ncbi:hypothetical protein MPTK1_1g05100 [Marchantia polymorpha subsp. ruderalis]|uniref:Uncharacterized protein n=2 Tax=Marchantia polymorpha TaxID=3197 RepID=A0AAF6ALN4_MARPO|nr:hypothetical protein MARPO_0005s0097 [Marchantia polymorpha]BBM97354.1 hypothetical protein Mp_1g05100 [Marchantia polymorpha subsp. ruderalis]|eukprot:PTQ48451.1 hypothetical protein MARPO_0005s0097 [Marchantia polymorpha]
MQLQMTRETFAVHLQIYRPNVDVECLVCLKLSTQVKAQYWIQATRKQRTRSTKPGTRAFADSSFVFIFQVQKYLQ